MLLHRLLTLTGFLSALAVSASAYAGLYGFTYANPYTYEEEILDIGVPQKFIVNYRQAMRNNVISLSTFAKTENKNFEIIAHEGEDLLHKSLWEYHLDGYNEARSKGVDANDPVFLSRPKQLPHEHRFAAGSQAEHYLKQLSGIVINNRFCSNRKLSPHVKEAGLKVISIDRCPDESSLDEAIMNSAGFNSLLYAFVKPASAFKKIKKQLIINENARNIYSVNDAENISLIIDDSQYTDRERFLQDIRDSNYDLVILNPFFQHKEPFTKEEIDSLKFKKNGAKRLVFAKMNISEADSNDYYWKEDWQLGKPTWLVRPSFTDNNSIITEYWHEDWKKVMGLYFKGIVKSNYDGAFLTGLENHAYFEKQTPLE